MILDKEETEELATFLVNVKSLLLETDLNTSTKGMIIYDQANDWLVKLEK